MLLFYWPQSREQIKDKNINITALLKQSYLLRCRVVIYAKEATPLKLVSREGRGSGNRLIHKNTAAAYPGHSQLFNVAR